MTERMADTRRVALVTGASSGIGRAVADRLASEGWKVWGASRTAGKPSPAATAAPGAWTPLPLDVTVDGSVAAAITAVLGADGHIDALVHAAGISVAGSVEDITVAEAERQFATNYFGAVRLVRAVLPAMRARGRGRIVVIGSIGGLIGLPFLGHYSASKFALDGMIEALRHEVAPFGIEATALHPGDIRTAISERQEEGAATGADSAYHDRFRKAVATYDNAVRVARGPEVVAAAVSAVLARRRQPPLVLCATPAERAGVALKAALPRRVFEAILDRSYRF